MVIIQTYIGKTCPYCQFPIKQGSDVVLCSNCNIPHHQECWQQNEGCTTFGCMSKEILSDANRPRTDTILTADLYDNYIPSGPQIRPWVRYSARLTDLILFSLIFSYMIAIIYPSILNINDFLYGMVISVVFIFIEPLFLSTWGTTPGKALLNVRLRKTDGRKPSYLEALLRSFRVWFRGQGLNIPVAALITQIYAYDKLTGEGATTWDRDGGFSVSHKEIRAWRVILTIALYIGFVVLITWAMEY